MPTLMITVLIIFLPLVYLSSTLDPTQPLRQLILAITVTALSGTLLAGLYRRRREYDWTVLRRLIFPVWGLYVLISAFSVMQAVNSAEAVYDLSKILLSGVLLICAALVFSSDKRAVTVLAKSMLISGSLLAAIGVCQYFDLAFTSIPGNAIPYGTMANKNLFTGILCLTLPFGFYAVFRLRRFWIIAGLVQITLSLLIIVIAQTRASWVALAAATLIVIPLFLLWRRRSTQVDVAKPGSSRRITAVAAVALLIVFGAASGIVLRHGENSLGSRLTSIFTHQDTSSQERLGVWKASWTLFRQHPVLGVGIGNWKIACAGVGIGETRAERADIFFQQPHNDYLWVLTETGIPGLAVYLLVFVLAIAYVLRTLRHVHSRDEAALSLTLLFAVICFMVDSFFSFPRDRTELLTFLVLTLAAVASVHHRLRGSQRSPSRRFVAVALLLCLLSSVAAVAVGVIRLGGETHIKLAWQAKSIGNWTEVIRQIDLARSPLLTLDPTSTPLLWYRGVARVLLGEKERACQDFALANRDNPNHPQVLNNLGTCAELKDDHDQAVAYYERAVRIAPRFEDAWLNLTAVRLSRGEYTRADSALSHVGENCKDARVPVFHQEIAKALGMSTGKEAITDR